MVYITIGVSGCGKTTIGKILAKKLGVKFYDADDFHSLDNINKMKNLVSLEDEDRIPWLSDLAERIKQWNKDGDVVLACSALKEGYRRILSSNGKAEVVFIYLEGGRDTILQRMKERKGHFFALELLESQFDALEEPLNAIKVRIDKTPKKICEEIIGSLTKFSK